VRLHEELFRRQGAVVESWRSYRGRRLGPYYRLVYRGGRRNLAIYLGRSPELAEKVRALLDHFQNPIRQRRAWRRMRAGLWAEVRKQKAAWAKELAARGLALQEFEVRGWRLAKKFPTVLLGGPRAMPLGAPWAPAIGLPWSPRIAGNTMAK